MKNKSGRIYLDNSKDSNTALKLLRDNGFKLVSFNVFGSMGPELVFNHNVYYGLNEIKEFIEKYKDE